MQKRRIKEMGMKEYMFQVWTTPRKWSWQYDYNYSTGVLNSCSLLDDDGYAVAIYDGLKCRLVIYGDEGTSYFDTDAPVRTIQKFVFKWIKSYEGHPEKGWDKRFKLYDYYRKIEDRAVVEDAKLLPVGWNWYTQNNRKGKFSWLEDKNGKVICEYDFAKETFCFEKKWRDIRHEQEADFREYIELKTREKMTKALQA